MSENQKGNKTKSIVKKTILAPLDIIRTETVISKLPIHTLSKTGNVDIHLTQKNSKGKFDTLWRVSPNRDFGEPRQLAFKIDKLIINRRIDELNSPIPQIIRLGSLRDIARELDCGGDTNIVKRAFSQNASAFITAKFNYMDSSKQEKQFEMQGTRYSLIFTGEQLPGGGTAEVVYIILNDPYLRLINSVEKRPLDFEYMKQLTPGQLRWYELASFKMYASFKYKRSHAKLLYSEYCLSAPQKRHDNYDAVKKQMYKIHRPHIQSGYIKKISYKTMIGDDGKPDWIMYYYPGEKSTAEFEQFTKKKLISIASEETKPISLDRSSALDEADQLVTYFYYRFHKIQNAKPTAKAYRQAQELIADYGFQRAKFVIDYVDQHSRNTTVKPQHFGFILSYAPQAIAEFDKHQNSQDAHRSRQQRERLEESYQSYREQQVLKIREQISSDELTLLRNEILSAMDQNNTSHFGRNRTIEIEIDKALEERYGVLSFKQWLDQFYEPN